jgi:hypothetical protein
MNIATTKTRSSPLPAKPMKFSKLKFMLPKNGDVTWALIGALLVRLLVGVGQAAWMRSKRSCLVRK